MTFLYKSFADCYNGLIEQIQMHSTSIQSRGKVICYEMVSVQLIFPCANISIYSHPSSRVTPITFTLAEFLWILSGSNMLSEIVKFNKSMKHYSDNGVTLSGAYGWRLGDQIECAIKKLLNDKYSRQAYCTISFPGDIYAATKDVPCNTAFQFLIRDDKLVMIVNSRSSDFVTGLSIDAVHWQMLYHLVLNSLRKQYNNLQTGNIIYNIASLHVYETDKEMLQKWATYFAYEHNLRNFINDDYDTLRNRAQLYFSQTKNLNDIFSIYDCKEYNKIKIIEWSKYTKNEVMR